MSNFPTCQVCQQQFSQKGPAPFLLPCLHVVCETCVTSAAGGVISCKPCQSDVNLTETRLQKDVITENEILHLTVKHHPELVLCTLEEDGNQAVCWCKECEDFLCENCQMTHGRLKITRQHVVEDLGDLQPESFDVDDYCTVHPKFVLDTWDEECCVLICTKCKLGDHAEHKTFDIDEAAETTKREVADLEEEIRASVTQQGTHLKTMDRDLQASDETCGLLTEEIFHTFKTLKTPLEQREKELQVELQQHKEEVRRGMIEKKNISEACQKKCQTAFDYISKTLNYSSRHDIMSLRQILQSKSKEFIGLSRAIVYESPQLPRFYTDGLEKIKSALVGFGSVARKDDQTAANRTIDFGIQTDDWVSGELEMAKKEVMQLKTQHEKEIQSLRETFKREKEEERKGTRVEFSKTKFNKKYVHINSKGELVNRKGSSSSPHSYQRLKKYAGTSSTVTLPQGESRQYFEVKTRVDIDGTLTKNNLLFEIGFTTEEDQDKYPFVAKYAGCYSLTVQHCPEHESICRKIWSDGDDIQCVPDTLENVPGATATLHYGVVYDSDNSFIAFIDVMNKEAIGNYVHVDSSSVLWPMFGVYSSPRARISMALVVGSDIDMTEYKKTLISQSV